MKKTKFLSVLTATAISACMMFGTLGTASACSNCNPPTDEVHGMGDMPDYYTLDQLFKMSDEEFLALENAQTYYNEVKADSEYFMQVSNSKTYGGISGKVWTNLYEDEGPKYTANQTEREIKELLGDSVKYEISSPISLDVNYLVDNFLYYGNILMVEFPEYNLYSQTNTITDKEIIEFSKCWYCVNQVIDVDYWHFLDVLSSEPGDEQVVTGDVNFDKNFNLYDVIWIAKSLINEFELTKAQVIVADTNGDGVADLHDAINLAKKLME